MAYSQNQDSHTNRLSEKGQPPPVQTASQGILYRMTLGNLENPYPLIAMLMGVIVFGFLSIRQIPRDIFPSIPIPVVMVATFYPGMNSSLIERNITSILERQFTMAGDVESIHSRSLNGISLVKVIFHSQVPIGQAVSEINELSLSILPFLPPGTASPMVVSYSYSNVPLCHILLTSDSISQARLYDLATNVVRPQLGGIEGVSSPPIFGGKVRQINMYLHPERLINRKMTPLDVVDAIYRQNLLIPTGNIRMGELNYLTQFNNQAPDLSALGEIPIKLSHGVPVFVRDVSSIEDSFAPQENMVLVDGVPSVILPIYRESGYSALDVISRIKKALPHLDKVPAEVKTRILFDQTIYTKEALSSLMREAFLGILTSGILIFLVLGEFRQALLGIIALPIAYLADLTFLHFSGETLNIMTLGGLAIAVGPMIDHLVLVVESLKSHEPAEGSPPSAIMAGLVPILRPTVMATLAMIVVFFPLLFLGGLVHFLFWPLGISVIGANIVSVILSLILIPWLVILTHRFGKDKKEKIVPPLPLYLEKVFDRYMRFLDQLLVHPAKALLAIALLLIVILPLGHSVPQSLYPEVDAGQFRIFVHFPSGSRLSASRKESVAIDHLIRNSLPKNTVTAIVSNIGIKAGWSSIFNPNAGTDTAIIDVALVSKNHRHYSTAQAIKHLEPIVRKHFENTIFLFKASGIVQDLLSRGRITPVIIEIHGDHYQSSMLFAKRLAGTVRNLPGVLSSNVFQRPHYPALKIDVDRTLGKILGTEEDEVAKNVQVSLNSNNAIRPIPWIDPVTGFFYYLSVMYPPEKFTRMEDLTNLPVAHTPKGSITYLGELARVTHQDIPEEIDHDRLDRAIDVLVAPSPGESIQISDRINHLLNNTPTPPGIHIRFVGMTTHIRHAFSSLTKGILLAVFFLFLLLLVFYRSFIAPLIVLGVVPLGIIGSMALLGIFHSSLNLVSIMGIFMTIGIVASNSILLVNRYLRYVNEGIPLREAILRGSRERIRPILITSLSAITAMIPVAIRFGVGSENTLPLARSVIGGLLVATPLTLFLIPVLSFLFLKKTEQFISTHKGTKMINTSSRSIILALFLAASLASCHKSPEGDKITPIEGSRPTVLATQPTITDLPVSIRLPGTVTSYQSTEIHPQVLGYLKTVSVDIGSKVQKNDILAQIDIPELRTHFMRALANYQYRLTLLNRFRQTLKESPDLISREEVDQAQNLYLSALANLREDVTQLQFSVIRAPFSGIITRRYVDPGALVGQKGTSSPLFRLEDISRVRVRIDIPQASVDDVTIGTPALITVKNDPDHPISGKIALVSHALNPDSKTMPVEAIFDNDNERLKPGMFIRVSLLLHTLKNRLTIPDSAIMTRNGLIFIYVVNRNGAVEERRIFPGEDNGVRIEILKGVSLTEKVIVSGKHQVLSGDHPIVREDPEGKQ